MMNYLNKGKFMLGPEHIDPGLDKWEKMYERFCDETQSA